MQPLQGPWVLDQLGHAGAEHLDPEYVAGYDRKSGFDPSGDVAELLLRGLDGGSTIVDMGCGTGAFVVAVAPHCERVVAVDVSAAMVDQLRRRVDDAGIDNVDVVHAGFLDYEHVGAPADFVFTRNALHQLPDFWKSLALRRVASMMCRGGTLWLRDLVYTCEPDEIPGVLEGWFAAAVADPRRGYTAADLEEHVRLEFSTFSWLLQPMLEHAGFRVADVEVDPRRTYARYECVLDLV